MNYTDDFGMSVGEITVTELGSDIFYDSKMLPDVTTGNSLNITSMPFYN